MLVVKRGFRNLGQMLTVGSEISDPTVIKHLKSRISAGDIVVVTEHNYDAYQAYFKAKFEVDLPSVNIGPADNLAKETVPKDSTKTVAKPKATVTAKAVVK